MAMAVNFERHSFVVLVKTYVVDEWILNVAHHQSPFEQDELVPDVPAPGPADRTLADVSQVGVHDAG